MQEFSINIPIRSYLKKYIASHNEVEPFQLSLNKCHFSAIFFESMNKDFKRVNLKESNVLNDTITIGMNSTVQKKKRFWMDDKLVQLLDQRLKSMFDQQLIDFVTIENKKRGDIKVSILLFMDYYDITEDDLTWDAVCKMYYRARYSVPKVKQERMQELMDQQLDLFS